jgi:hypothetical protein
MRFPLVDAILTLTSAPQSLLANDSTAVLDAGGLQLTVSPDITMEREDLYLSTEQVRVRYVFRNQSDRDITTRVAFPLPDVPFGPADNVALPNDKDNNFVVFSVVANGQRIEPSLEQRAISSPVETDEKVRKGPAAGTDLTARVLEAGLPLNPNLPSWKEKLRSLPHEVRERLLHENILYDTDGTADEIQPQWSLRETFHWEQTFPAGQSIPVEHSYKPVVGSSYFVGESGEKARLADYKRKYCLDSAGQTGVERLIRKAAAANSSGGDTQAYVFANEVGYILTTGANWKGSIGSFKLTIDKLEPDAIVSFCVDGTKKVGPTTFAVQQSNFAPKEDVRFVVFKLKTATGK